MKTYRYAILPLFAFSLAVSSPVLAGEGASPNVPPEDATGSSEVYENDAVGVDEADDETAKLPFETDPDQNDPGTGDAAAGDDAGDAGAAADAGGADDGSDATSGGETGDTSAAAGSEGDSDSAGET